MLHTFIDIYSNLFTWNNVNHLEVKHIFLRKKEAKTKKLDE